MEHKQDGFSIVEVMVAMIILSAALIAVSNVIAVSSFQHRLAQCKNDAEYLARKKLTELQDAQVSPTPGADTVMYKNMRFMRRWKLTGTELCLAEVAVVWKRSGREETVDVSGYIESNTACRLISPNMPPKSIELFSQTKGKITGDTVQIAHQTPENRFVCRVVSSDPDSAKGDQVKISFDGGSDGAPYFRLSGDTLYTKTRFDTPLTGYSITIQALDCAGNRTAKKLTVFVKAPSTKPKAESPQRFSAVETLPAGGLIGSLSADEPMTSELSWSSSSAVYSVETNGTVKLKTASLNYERTALDSFTVSLKRSTTSEDSTVKVFLTVRDTNEAPTDIVLYPGTFKKGAPAGFSVGDITITDPDSNAVLTAWKLHTVSITGSGADRYTVNDRKLCVKNDASAPVGTDTVQLTASDMAGGSLTKKILITVIAPDPKCSDYPAYNSKSTYPNAGMVVAYLNKLWKSKWYVSPGALPGKAQEWQETGVCQ